MEHLGRAVPGALAPVPTCIPHSLPGSLGGQGGPHSSPLVLSLPSAHCSQPLGCHGVSGGFQ